jgi:hypothetical protein
MADTGHTIDERWMPEWLERGFADLAHYLAAWARFEQWCQEQEARNARKARSLKGWETRRAKAQKG